MMAYGAFASRSTSLLSGGLDNIGDALTYALSLAVVGATLEAQARVAFVKGLLISLAALAVAGQLVYRLRSWQRCHLRVGFARQDDAHREFLFDKIRCVVGYWVAELDSSCCLRHPYLVSPRGLYTFKTVIRSRTMVPPMECKRRLPSACRSASVVAGSEAMSAR